MARRLGKNHEHKVIDINEVSLCIKRAILRELPWIIADISILLYFFMMLFLSTTPIWKSQRHIRTLFYNILYWMLIELATMLTNYKKKGRTTIIWQNL